MPKHDTKPVRPAKGRVGISRASPVGACPSNDEMLRFLLNALGPDDQVRLEAHIYACTRCHPQLEGLRLGFKLSFDDDESES
jgi:hypothetical protein